MKLAIEIARITADGKVLRKSFEVGTEVAKSDFEKLFSEAELEYYHSMDDFSLTSSFNEDTMKVKLHSKAPGILLNDESVDVKGSIFLIREHNNLQVGDKKFRCQLIVSGTTTRRRRF
ncbi:MAG: hypothetical protein ACD_5C00309G0003 [uncultured bacterium]|nr:MAG: hypothetical protein ACD_5C00309G0003 [uncultured bacterium]